MIKKIGYMKPDGWNIGEDIYIDDYLPEPFDLRISTHQPVIESLAIKITKIYPMRYNRNLSMFCQRCHFEWVREDEDNIKDKGYIKHDARYHTNIQNRIKKG